MMRDTVVARALLARLGCHGTETGGTVHRLRDVYRHQRRCMENSWPRIAASVAVNLGVIAGATGATRVCRTGAAAAPGWADRLALVAPYKVCGRNRTHHASNRLQSARTSKRTGPTGTRMVVAD
jgi:hypothetical protein